MLLYIVICVEFGVVELIFIFLLNQALVCVHVPVLSDG